jgi:hypothetical protein
MGFNWLLNYLTRVKTPIDGLISQVTGLGLRSSEIFLTFEYFIVQFYYLGDLILLISQK